MWFKQGQIEVEYGDESEFGDVECEDKGRDGCAKKTSPAGILLLNINTVLNPIPNQSKPIA